VIGVKVWIFRGEILTRQEELAKRTGGQAHAG
jgi:ribosomal protein S3